mgnify:CR=1 FL=1
MHVLILGSRESIPERRGAIERLTFELASGLVKREFEVTVFTVGEKDKEYITEEGIKIYELCEPIRSPPSYIYPMLAFSKRARKKYEELKQKGEKFDIIHSVFYPNLLGFRTKEPTVVSEHNPYPWKKEFKYIPELSSMRRIRWEADCLIRKLEATYVFRRCEKIICVSNAQKKWITSSIRCDKGKLEVIYNGVDTNKFHPIVNTNELRESFALNTEKIILFVGRKAPHKGLHHLVRILPNIKDARLVVVGPISTGFAGKGYDPYIQYIMRLIERHSLRDRVIFTGYISEEDLPKYYAMADVFAYPSMLESFGLVILEAMACGTPVVAYNIEPVTEFVEDDEGILVPIGNINKLSESIDFLLDHEKIKEKMGVNARKKAEQFSLEIMCEKYIDVYKKVVGEAI